MIWLIHPDENLREALADTVRAAWEGIECLGFAPNSLPKDIPLHCVALCVGAAPDFPAERLVRLDDADGARPLKAVLKQAEAILRQSYWPTRIPLSSTAGEAVLDTRTREWLCDDNTLTLTEKEVATLVYLWQRPAPATREDLLRDVWHYASDADTHTIETHIYRLRQKIEADPADPRFLVTTKDGYQLAARAKA